MTGGQGRAAAFCLVVAFIIIGLVGGCVPEQGDSVSERDGYEAELKQVVAIDGSWPTYLRESDTMAFERRERDDKTWIFLLRDGKEKRLLQGSSPSLSRRGLFYISSNTLRFRSEFDKKPAVLGPKNVDSVFSSSSGDEVILLKPDRMASRLELHLWETSTRRAVELELPPELYPYGVSWATGSEVLVDAAVGELKGERSIFSLKLPGKDAETHLLAEGYDTPSSSPNGQLLASLGSTKGSNLVSVVVLLLPDLREIASLPPSSPYSSYVGPIVWLSDNRLAVTEQRHDARPRIRVLEIVRTAH